MSSSLVSMIGPPVQIAYAVRDLDDAVHEWVASHGAGPFFVYEHIEVHDVRYRGTPSTFDHSSAYGQSGDLMIELVVDHSTGPSPVADVVGFGGVGLHHVAHFVDDLENSQALLAKQGWAEALWARTSSGVAFAFHDATAVLGHMIELYEGVPGLRAFYARVREASIGWDGSDPIRRR